MNLLANLLAWVLGLLRLVWRLALLAFGLGMALALVVIGTVVWLLARLLGKPATPVQVRWRRGSPFGTRPNATPDDNVVDVQAREVPEPPSATPATQQPDTTALPGPNTPPPQR